MNTVTENDLKGLKDDIKEVNQKIDKLTEMVTNLTIGQVELREKLNSVNTRLDSQDKALQKIPDLAEKVGELKNWRAIALVIVSGLITSLFWLLRTGKI